MTELGIPPAGLAQSTQGGGALLLALLFAGHAAADFVLQTRSMVDRKHTRAGLFVHILFVLTAHLVILAPVFSGRVVLGVAVIVVAHFLIDLAKSRLGRGLDDSGAVLWLFVIDQLLHVAVLIGVWAWLTRSAVPVSPWVSDVAAWTLIGWWIAAYAFNANGAGSLVALILDALPRTEPTTSGTGASVPHLSGEDRSTGGLVPKTPSGRGRAIGILERWLILTLLLVGQWGVIGFVLAAKSIARFDQLKEQTFAEYYLIGTLLSVLFAIGTGLLLGLV